MIVHVMNVVQGMNVCIRVVCGGVLFGSIGQYSVYTADDSSVTVGFLY